MPFIAMAQHMHGIVTALALGPGGHLRQAIPVAIQQHHFHAGLGATDQRAPVRHRGVDEDHFLAAVIPRRIGGLQHGIAGIDSWGRDIGQRVADPAVIGTGNIGQCIG